jgi:hypothetical protein
MQFQNPIVALAVFFAGIAAGAPFLIYRNPRGSNIASLAQCDQVIRAVDNGGPSAHKVREEAVGSLPSLHRLRDESPDGTRVTRDEDSDGTRVTRDEEPDGTRVTRDDGNRVTRDEDPDCTRVTRHLWD